MERVIINSMTFHNYVRDGLVIIDLQIGLNNYDGYRQTNMNEPMKSNYTNLQNTHSILIFITTDNRP